MSARTVHVVVQTHWDREWYLTREATLARSAEVMARALDALESGALPCFLFDGQTAAYRDLLAVAEPALADRLRAQAAAGRLLLGPWFIMADEFLVSGESLLRNLAFGLADARGAGAGDATPHVGYLPDSFGHVAQMPQILRQFGIDCAVLWRGADAPDNWFEWVAPDGSVAGTVFLPEGYYQHPLNLPDWRTPLTTLLGRLAARTPAGPLLLTQGGDHLAPSPQLAARIAEFNATQDEWQLQATSLVAHVRAARDARAAAGLTPTRLHGELRHNRQAFVLPDVLSTRRPLKLAHQLAEDRLLGEIEPMLACLWPRTVPAPEAALQRCWRELVEQQAHDSICGCSTDAVHAEMAQRFVLIGQQLDALRQRTLAAAGAISLMQHGHDGPSVWADDGRFMLFNPLPQRREGWWTVDLFLAGEAPAAVAVHDADGTELPCALLAVVPHRELVSPLDDFPEPVDGHRCTVALRAGFAGLGALDLHATRRATAGDGPQGTEAAPLRAIDNAAWSVSVDGDGSLRLVDRRRGDAAAPALSVISELDAGDSYNHSPPARPLATWQRGWRLVSGRRCGAVQELVLATEIELPAALDDTRAGAAAARVTCRGELWLRLFGDEPLLHLQLHWHNAARDQRTRLLLPCDGATTSVTDTAFAWTTRALQRAEVPAEPSRREAPVAVLPSLSAVAAGPWALGHRALHEVELLEHAGRRWLGLTLVRSVGWLSRRDLRTRGVGAGPDIATPGAQCLGDDVFDLVLHAGGEPADALAAAAVLRRPPVLLRGHAPDPEDDAVDVGNPRVQASSVRRVDGRLELRLWNPLGEEQSLALDPTQWQVVRADGQPAPGRADRIGGHAILTLRSRA